MAKRVAHVMVLGVLVGAGSTMSQEQSAFNASLGFEVRSQENGMPVGWRGGPSATISLDTTILQAGKSAARIHRTPDSEGWFSSLTNSILIDFQGDTIEIRGFLRTQDVSNYAGLWIREDGPNGQIAIDTMQNQQLRGTTDWSQYRVRLPLAKEARQVAFGVILSGTGTVWADDLELFVDDRPLSDAGEP